MLLPFFYVLAAARVVQGQTFGNVINTYGAVAFIRTGERTPWVRSGTTERLTALGAQQMYELGQNFRGRYIDRATGQTRLGVRPIEGMAQDRLNPDQLFIQAPDKPYLAAAAQAFVQGLYPPVSLNDTRSGPFADAVGSLADGTVVDFPLEGYQYANIRTVGSMDPRSIYLDGQEECPNARWESTLYEASEQFLNVQAAESAFYQSLNLSWFDGDIPEGMLDYTNAYAIYDSLSYHYTHDANIRADLSNDNNMGVFEKVRYLANQDAWYRYGNVSSDADAVSAARAMAGKTLAALILGRFQDTIANNGNTTNGFSQPLTLLFGDFEPLLSFLSVVQVEYSQNRRWRAIPEYASAVIIELFTRGEATADDPENLWVRFSFHNGTDDYDGTAPRAFSIFRNGPSRADMPWREFSSGMSSIMVNQIRDWCDGCSASSIFCWGVDDSTVNVSLISPAKSSHSKVSPVVAGVIGAIVTLAVAGLLFGIAMLLGGIRFHRVSPRGKSSLGGFKGSAKLASDADLSIAKNGVAPAGAASFGSTDGDAQADTGGKKAVHERVGSWELRQKERGAKESPRGSFEAIEAAMSKPVQPTESI